MRLQSTDGCESAIARPADDFIIGAAVLLFKPLKLADVILSLGRFPQEFGYQVAPGIFVLTPNLKPGTEVLGIALRYFLLLLP